MEGVTRCGEAGVGTGEEEAQRAGGRESGQEKAREYLIEGGAADSLRSCPPERIDKRVRVYLHDPCVDFVGALPRASRVACLLVV